jgi:hypothetical protein
MLAGQKRGIKEVDDGIWLVSFMHYDLGYFDLEQKTLQPSTTRPARGCHPCLRYKPLRYKPLRYKPLPMCPGRTKGKVAAGVRDIALPTIAEALSCYRRAA